MIDDDNTGNSNIENITENPGNGDSGLTEKKKGISPVLLIPVLFLLIGAGVGAYFLFFAQPPRTSAKLPYSVFVGSYESLDDANQTANRLRKMKVSAYVVKKLKEGENFSMDVHAGAFRKPEAAGELKKKLEDMGLLNLRVTDFNEIEKEVTEFEKLGDKEKKEFTLSNVQVPELSEAVLANIAYFPVDRNFRVMSLKIEDCAYNLEKVAEIRAFAFDPAILPEGVGIENLLSQSKAVSQAVYEDKLFGYHVGITISSANNAGELYNTILETSQNNAGTLKKDQLEYKTRMGILKGKLFGKEIITDAAVDPVTDTASGSNDTVADTTGGADTEKNVKKDQTTGFTYIAFIPETNHVLMMTASDCPQDNFMNLITRGGNENGLLYFPEIRKNLFVLPKVTGEEKLRFSCYDFDTVKQDYAEERRNVEWAKNIVGNYLSCCYYIKDVKDCLSVAFFNLNFTAAAKNVHDTFMKDKKTEDYGVATNVHESEGWYIDWLNSNELSFTYGSYIIALDLYNEFDQTKYTSMEYEEMMKAVDVLKEQRLALMQKYADTLQIWSKTETKEEPKDKTL